MSRHAGESVRQDVVGWAWVAMGAVATLALPAWVLLTAVVLQLSPEAVTSASEVSLGPAPEPTLSDAIGLLWRGATSAAGLLAWALVPGAAIGVVAVGVSALGARRSAAQREVRDAEVAPSAVIQKDSMTVASRELSPLAAEQITGEAVVKGPAQTVLADPWRRVGAALVDVGLSQLTLLPLQVALYRTLAQATEAAELPPGVVDVSPTSSVVSTDLVQWGALITIPLVLALGVAQLVLLAKGRTVGKWRLGLRIVDAQGQPADLVRAFLLRGVVWTVLLGIPLIGWIVLPLIEVALLFGEDRRTPRDLIAGTFVVDERAR